MKRKRYLLIGISIFLVAIFTATASFAQKKVKLVYWTHWEQNPIFNAYYAALLSASRTTELARARYEIWPS